MSSRSQSAGSKPATLNTASASTSCKHRRQHECPTSIHPYILKFETHQEKLSVMLNKMFELAATDLLVCDHDSGLNDFDMNLQFADKLDNVGKLLVGLSKRRSDEATKIRDKVDQAKDRKANLQDVVCIGEVLKFEDKCEKAKCRTTRSGKFITNEQLKIKKEPMAVYVSSDSETEQDEAGDMDTKFTYVRSNSYTNNNYTCLECGKKTHDSQDLRNHTSNHKKELFRCMRCFTVCRSERSFYNHKLTHEKPSHMCPHPDCGMYFTLKTSYTNHLQKHSADWMRCDVCGKTFQYRQSHIEHIKYRHRTSRTVPCPVCKKLFWTPTSMRSHHAKYHGLVSEMFRVA